MMCGWSESHKAIGKQESRAFTDVDASLLKPPVRFWQCPELFLRAFPGTVNTETAGLRPVLVLGRGWRIWLRRSGRGRTGQQQQGSEVGGAARLGVATPNTANFEGRALATMRRRDGPWWGWVGDQTLERVSRLADVCQVVARQIVLLSDGRES